MDVEIGQTRSLQYRRNQGNRWLTVCADEMIKPPKRLVKKTESENEMELEEYRVGKWENAYQLGYVSSYQANEKRE